MEGGYAFRRWSDKRGACQTGSQAEGGIGADDQLGAAGAGAFEPGRGRRDAKGGVVAEQGMVQPVEREIPQQGMVGGIARGERHGFGR